MCLPRWWEINNVGMKRISIFHFHWNTETIFNSAWMENAICKCVYRCRKLTNPEEYKTMIITVCEPEPDKFNSQVNCDYFNSTEIHLI